jgi:hypothetical protein
MTGCRLTLARFSSSYRPTFANWFQSVISRLRAACLFFEAKRSSILMFVEFAEVVRSRKVTNHHSFSMVSFRETRLIRPGQHLREVDFLSCLGKSSPEVGGQFSS